MDSETVWRFFESAAVSGAIVNVVVGGGIAHFKVFVVSEKDFLQRIRLKQEALREGLAKSLQRIFDAQLWTIKQPVLPSQNLFTEHVSEQIRVYQVFHRLHMLYSRFKLAYNFLLGTAGAGLVGFLLAYLWPLGRRYVGVACVVIIFLQLSVIFWMRTAARGLESYEEIA